MAWPQSREFFCGKLIFCMSRLENHVMLRNRCFNLQYALLEKYGLAAIEGVFLRKTDFLGNCSHEGQIQSSGPSSIFAQHLKEETRGLL